MFLVKKITFWSQQFLKYLGPVIHLQLFIFLCTLPCFSYWGLPVSYISILANIIIAPFFVGYLALLLAIFICAVLSIPCSFLLYIIEWVTHWWLFFLSKIDSSSLISLGWVGWMFNVIFLIVICVILQAKHITHRVKYVCYGIVLLLYVVGSFQLNTHTMKLAYEDEHITICSRAGKMYMYCDETFKQQGSSSFVRYTLLPQLRKNGITSIYMILCSTSNTATYRALNELIDGIPIQYLYCVAPQRKYKKMNDAWQQLKQTAQNERVILQSLCSSEINQLCNLI